MNSNFDIRTFAEVVSKDKRTLEMFRYLINNAYIRVVNYHNTNAVNAERFEQEIKYFSEHFVPVTIEDVDRFFETKVWPYKKPGLIPAIFEGYRNHYDVILPILEKYNFTGWFYIPSFFMDVEPQEQIAFCHAHRLRIRGEEQYRDGRVAMNWEEVRIIANKHVICCHTGSHYEITEQTTEEDMRKEIIDAKKCLEEHIGREIDVFCWLAGEEYNYSPWAHKYFEEAGYTYVVSNLKLEKIR